MYGLLFSGIEKISHERLADPEIVADTDAIVAVTHAAICGSDLHVYHGRETGLDHGTVMGHEFTGTVVAVGKEVRGVHRGDRVACPFTTNCGRCHYCRIGLPCRCIHGHLFGWVENGSGLHGTQAEYVRVPHADGSLVRLPDEINDETGLVLGDVLATGTFVADGARIDPAGTYAILGCGPVGLMAVTAARYRGARNLYAVDRIPERLALAEEMGAIPLDFSRTDVVAEIRRATDGRGADAVMEAVGSPAASNLAYDLVRPGGIISIAGVHNEPHFTITPTQAYDKNLTITIGRCPARAYIDELIEMVRAGNVPDPTMIFSHRMLLSRGAEGYRIFADRADGCTKVLLTPD